MNRFLRLIHLVNVAVLAAGITCVTAEAQTASPSARSPSWTLPQGEPAGKPEYVRKIDFKDFGSICVRFGDLDGDGQADAVVAQMRGQQISCLTAFTLPAPLQRQLLLGTAMTGPAG